MSGAKPLSGTELRCSRETPKEGSLSPPIPALQTEIWLRFRVERGIIPALNGALCHKGLSSRRRRLFHTTAPVGIVWKILPDRRGTDHTDACNEEDCVLAESAKDEGETGQGSFWVSSPLALFAFLVGVDSEATMG
jgi:hypothetical protein